MYVLTVMLAVVISTGFLMFGSGKIMGQAMMAETRERLGVAEGLWKVIGALEVAGAHPRDDGVDRCKLHAFRVLFCKLRRFA